MLNLYRNQMIDNETKIQNKCYDIMIVISVYSIKEAHDNFSML